MAWFSVVVSVDSVRGTQTFSVEADSPADALGLIKAGEGEITAEELEVQSLWEFHLEDVEEVESPPPPLGLESPTQAEILLASAVVHLVEALDGLRHLGLHAPDSTEMDMAAAKTALDQEAAHRVLVLCHQTALLPVPRDHGGTVHQFLGLENPEP